MDAGRPLHLSSFARITGAAALVVLGAFATGCGAASDATDVVTDSHSAALHGTWRAADGTERPAKLVVTQDMLSASVVLELEGHPCVPRSTIGAKITTSGVEGTAQIGGMTIRVSGDPGLEEIIGNFEAVADGPCPDQVRTFDVLFRR